MTSKLFRGPENLAEPDREMLGLLTPGIRQVCNSREIPVNRVVCAVVIINDKFVVINFIEHGATSEAFTLAVEKINPKITKQAKTLLNQAFREEALGQLRVLVIAATSRKITMFHLPLQEGNLPS